MPAPAPRHILALDQGTTSSRAIVFDPDFGILATAQKEFRQHFPNDGWVEHDASEIWESVLETGRAAISESAIGPVGIGAIGITNQRETAVLWDRSSGEPLAPAIVWQDRRTADTMARLRSDGVGDCVRETTGLVLDPYFSATKFAWLLDRVEGARSGAARGEILAGTVDSWLIYRLTGGRVHATDITNASRTLLMNLEHGDWDEKMLEIFRVPREILPRIVASSGVIGTTDRSLFGDEIPIAAAVGDQQAALFGQLCTKPGMVKCTYGTGCFLLAFAGSDRPRSRHGLLETVAWKLGDEPHQFALEGSVFVGGAAIQWLRDGLKLFASAPEVNPLAENAVAADTPVFVPSFTGLGAPHWDPGVRGVLFGLTRATGREEIARATVEGIAHQVVEVAAAMRKDLGSRIRLIRADGGASASDILLQIQANLLGVKVERPAMVESTALGAAMMAGCGAGFYRSVGDLEKTRTVERVFSPHQSSKERSARLKRWRKAVRLARAWSR